MTSIKRRRKLLISHLFLLLAGGLLVYGIWGLGQRYAATHNPTPAIPTQPVTYSTDTPEETSLADACKTHKVGPNEPRRIELPTLGKTGCIQKVSLDQHSAVAVPTNVHLAGWYTGSVLPGAKGVSLIDGHAQGRYSEGIFKKLDQLQKDQKIRIELGDGTWREFEVLQTTLHTVGAAAKEMLKPIEGIDTQLTLITCAGSYNEHDKTYDRRVIVRAKMAEL